MRTQLVEEIERLERRQKQREDELLAENCNLQTELASLNSRLSESKRREVDIDVQYKRQVEKLKTEGERALQVARLECETERDKANHYAQLLSHANEDLRTASEHTKEFNKERMQEILQAQQAEMQVEREQLATRLKEIEDLEAAKLEEKNAAIKAIEFELTEEAAIVERKYKTALGEKKGFETQFKALLETSKQKEEKAATESADKGRAVDLLLNEGTTKEQRVRQLVATLAQELLNLQKVFAQRETTLVEDAKRLTQERQALEEVVDRLSREAQEKVAGPEFASVYEAQKKELDLVLKQLEDKTAEVKRLKDKELVAFNGGRKTLTSTAEGLQSFMRSSKQSEERMRDELRQVATVAAEAEEQHTAEEMNSTAQITALNDELKKLRIEVRNKDAGRYEGKLLTTA